MSHRESDSTLTSSITTSHRSLETQADRYLDSLQQGLINEAYDAYKVAYRQDADTIIHALPIPGYTLSVVFRHQNTMTIQFIYWYLIQGWIIELRCMMPATQMASSPLPLFVNTVVDQATLDLAVGQPR
jgi:hypothetical protein